ncbi:MAG: hypothetical protein GX046_06305 [Tissierellia bacterium]|nr:hypothetical protein [Tissierellia bacterium]
MKGKSKMTSKTSRIVIVTLLVLVVLLSLRVVFDSKFDDFDKFVKTRENYEGGPEKFDEDFQGLIQWEKEYRATHPNATDKEVNEAFKKLWKN